MHTTLYRKWRPADFSSVIGQKHITEVLRYEVQNGKTTHAYLFCGSRGTGKTTCAKILAKAVNCLSPENGNPCGQCESCRSIEAGTATDIIEMDAASNNGVEYIREIREEVVYTPAFLKKKVYIIDEVHMLSAGAFNALLKTLEEPPEHVIFILATTELQKLPATITSRCQRFDFKRIGADDIAERLELIALKEDIALTHEAALLIARLSQGGMRDAISLLELCAGSGQTVDTVRVGEAAGVAGRAHVEALVRAVAAKDYPGIFGTIAELCASSTDLAVLWQELISYYRDMLVLRVCPGGERFLDLTEEECKAVKASAASFTKERLLYHIRLLEDASVTMQRASSLKRVCAEMTLVRLTDDRTSDRSDALLSRIAELESHLASGTAVPTGKTPPAPPAPPAESEEEKRSEAPVKPAEKPEGEAVSRPFEGWSEVARELERQDMGLASNLRMASARICGNRLEISVRDPFSKMLIEQKDNPALIAAAVNASGEMSGLTPDAVRVLLRREEEDGTDPLADF